MIFSRAIVAVAVFLSHFSSIEISMCESNSAVFDIENEIEIVVAKMMKRWETISNKMTYDYVAH